MPSRVIVLNGASSAGKTSLGRALQRQLGPGWFMLGVDDLLTAILPAGDDPALLCVEQDGTVRTTEAFRQAESAWYAGVAAIAAQAPGLVLDEVLLQGGTAQRRLAHLLGELPVAWVGVVCEQAVGERRERERGDRVLGMHAEQRVRVHEEVEYDCTVDTSRVDAEAAASEVLRTLRAKGLVQPGQAPP